MGNIFRLRTGQASGAWRIALRTACWLFVAVMLVSTASAQARLSLDQVVTGLKTGKPGQAELVKQVSELGVDFTLDITALGRLLDAGATPRLIEAIEDPRHAQPSRPEATDVTVFSGESTMGEEGPVTREHILAVLRASGDQALLAGLVTHYGIAFPYTPALGREFQNTGANPALLATIATATVGTALLPEGYSSLPLAKAKDYTGSEKMGRVDLRLFVDGAVEVRIQGGRVIYKTLQAQPVRDAGSEFTGDLPLRDFKKLEVAKRDGRGDFVILQRPAMSNEFLLILRIYDPKGGEDRYHLRIDWESP